MPIPNLRLKAIAVGLLAAATISNLGLSDELDQIALPGETLFPESLAIDEAGGVYVSSVLEARILYVTPEREIEDFVARGEHGLISVGGLKLSSDGTTLFACNSDLGMNEFAGASSPALLAFDVSDKSLTGRWELPGGGLCNDIAISEDGEVYVTDSFVPRVLKLSPDRTELTPILLDQRFTGEGFNLSGIVHTSDGLFVAKFNSGELYHIPMGPNGVPGDAVPLALSQPLFAPDGLALLNESTFLVAESAGRLVKVTVSGHEAQVEVLASDLRAPTAVSIDDGQAYVLIGQLDRLPNPQGSSPVPEPFRIEILDLAD